MADGRPKPLCLVKGHRTKAEKQARELGEKSILTGATIRENPEVRRNPIAHKEFTRIKKLLRAISKDDDLSGNIINLHCLLVAECEQIEKTKQMFIDNLEKFEDKVTDEEITFSDEMKIRMGMQKQILDCDKALMIKRKMILDISKENIMTIQSAMRSIPKKELPKQESPMAEFLKRKQAGGNDT